MPEPESLAVRQLALAAARIVREAGRPMHSAEVRRSMQEDEAVTRFVTYAEALAACQQAARDGRLRHVLGPAGGKWEAVE